MNVWQDGRDAGHGAREVRDGGGRAVKVGRIGEKGL